VEVCERYAKKAQNSGEKPMKAEREQEKHHSFIADIREIR
jgi:hypothetical protein